MRGPGSTFSSKRPPSSPGRERVLKSILAREADGLPLNHAAVLRDDRHLHAQILRLYGRWDDAIQAAGVDPRRIRRHRRWSQKAVIDRILQLDTLGLPLNAGAVQRNEATLASAASRWFRSWADALQAAGIDPELWRRRVPTWTRERVVAAIRQIRDEGGKLNHAAVGRSSLSRAAVDLFGCWDAALRAAGIDPDQVRVYRRPWTAQTLVTEIRRKHRAREPLNARDVSPNWIRRPACRLFGSWDAALAAAGLDPMTIRGKRPQA